jgi:mannose-6-phosphate isomerase-like protein (cupin superfamily)
LWPAGSSWFENDPLGRAPHSHPGASEIYFVASGRLHLTVGHAELDLSAGSFVLIPPDTFHDPRNGAPLRDLHLFALVVPNVRGAPWKTSGFDPQEFVEKAEVATVCAEGALPSDRNIESAVVELSPGAEHVFQGRRDADHTIYVLCASLQISVGRLSGVLDADEYLAIPGFQNHRIRCSSDVPARFISIWAHASKAVQ